MQSLSYKEDSAKISRVAETAVDAMFGRDVANVFAVAVGLSLVASVSAYVLTGPRVAYAMARDGVFPGFAARVHPTRETPAFATWTQAVAGDRADLVRDVRGAARLHHDRAGGRRPG